MITTLLTGVLTSVLFLSSVSPKAAPGHMVFTQTLSENNVVAYKVHEGETLETIAQNRYEDNSYWTTLWNDNAWIKDPNALETGTLLQVRVAKPDAPDTLVAGLVKDDIPEREVFYAEPTPVVAVTPAPAVAASTPSSYADIYKQAGAKYGIPWQILYGLHITETGGRDGAIFNGSGSGARGPMQFMPGTWGAYGVDGNGDGIADIDNAVDAIHGAANYLAKHGSLDNGLRSYGGNTAGTLALARAQGYGN